MDNQLLKTQMARWYPLIDHPTQIALNNAVAEGYRFPIVAAGRRSGKTERAKRFVAKMAMKTPGKMFFAAAPTYGQAKRIFWADLKALTLSCLHPQQPSESELIIRLPNLSEIHVIGLDKPQRFEGIPWGGGCIDEIADVKGESLGANIMPALNTIDPRNPEYRAWCWFTGVPEGMNHFYDMAQLAQSGDPDYKFFTWKSAEILPADVIAAAKRNMSPKQFRQEYEGSFETAGGKIYEDYSKANYTNYTVNPFDALHWSHDQNYTPLSSCIAVIRNGVPYFVDEIVLESAISRQSAEEFVQRYKNHRNKTVYIYGDPAGRAGEKHGHKSDYTEIEDVLRLNGWKFERRVKRAHPAIKDRQNSVRAKILAADGSISLYVNPKTAEWVHKGLATVQFLPGSTFQEDQTNKYQHITTAVGYFIDYHWPQGSSGIQQTITVGNY